MRRSAAGTRLPLRDALEQQRALRVPAPARLEHRRGEQRLDQHVARGRRVQVVEDVLEREAVLRPEREDDRLLVGGRLQLEAEADAEALAQREAPGAVDARRRTARARRAACRRSRRRSARGRRAAASARRRAPGARRRRSRRAGRRPPRAAPAPHSRAQATPPARGPRRARLAQRRRSRPTARACAPGASPSQNGMRRRLALGVGHAHDAGLDAQDPPGRVAELEDVAAVGLDGEVLVDRADERALGLEAHLVVGGVRDRAAGRERGQARALASPCSAPFDAVAVEQRARGRRVCSATTASKSSRVRSRYGQARRNALEERVLVPGLGDARGDDLLGEDVERRAAAAACGRARRRARSAAAPRPRPARRASAGRAGPSARARARGRSGRRAGGSVAIERVAPTWITRSTSPMSMPSSSDAVATSARSAPGLQPLLGVEPALAREAAVVAGHRVLAEQLA